MTTIDPLSTPPSRSDPATFSARADTFLGELPARVAQFNAVAGEVNAASVAAIAASAAAIAASGATAWASGATYSAGACVWSGVDFQTYRRRSAGSGIVDPSNDPANWTRISGDLLDVAIAASGTCASGTRELCAAAGAITRVIPDGLPVGGIGIGFADDGQLFTRYPLTLVPPAGHRFENAAVNETLLVTRNGAKFELRQTAAGVWRIF